MKFQIFSNQIIGKENPWLIWFFGGATILFSSIFLGLWHSGLFGNSFFGSWKDYFVTALGVGLIGIGVVIAYGGSFTTLTVDRTLQKVSLRRAGIFGETLQEFSFAEIESFLLIEKMESSSFGYHEQPLSNKSQRSYFFGLKLKNGEEIKIGGVGSYDETSESADVTALNEFIGQNRS